MAQPARLSGKTRLAIVIGDPVRHSLSPIIHNAAFAACGLDWVFLACEVPEGRVPDALAGAVALDVAGSIAGQGFEELAITVDDADRLGQDYDAVIITAALDDFARCPGELEWRGIEMRSRFEPTDDPGGVLTPAYVTNRPSTRVPYTRTVETKHATGQQIKGTVVSEEMPGAPRRHYPVLTADGANERRNAELCKKITERFDIPVYFAGRLATYRYINQDEAIADAMAVAHLVAAELGG